MYAVGRYLYGIAFIGIGICDIVWHTSTGLQQMKALTDAPFHDALAYIVGIVEIVAGAAVIYPAGVRFGAPALAILYGIFVLLAVPVVIRHPLVYNAYANLFEQLSIVCGAVLLYAKTGSLARWAYYAFGICVISFTVEQLLYLRETATLVPKYLPPGQMFWAVATTIAFAIAAIALLSRYHALLASRLLTAMLLGFGLLVWVPAVVGDPHQFSNWSEGLITLVVAATSWIVAGYLSAGDLERSHRPSKSQ